MKKREEWERERERETHPSVCAPIYLVVCIQLVAVVLIRVFRVRVCIHNIIIISVRNVIIKR